MPDCANPLLLYDGVCGLCNRLVRFVLKRDTAARFRFASLQSDYAARILQRHGLELRDLDTVYVVESPGDRPKDRSDAVIFILRELGGFWRVAATVLRIFPGRCGTGDTASWPVTATAFSENTKAARSPKPNIKTDFWIFKRGWSSFVYLGVLRG